MNTPLLIAIILVAIGAWFFTRPKAPAAFSDAPPVASKPLQLNVGTELVIEQKSPDGKYSVVFEDDGSTGYFYALDYKAKGETPIQEAMSIYDVKNVTDKSKPSSIVIVWTSDSKRAALFINDYPHAVFDFDAHRGYCRTNFPAPGKWGANFKWDDSILAAFRKEG